jgi:ribose transport system substrate-binding protein
MGRKLSCVMLLACLTAMSLALVGCPPKQAGPAVAPPTGPAPKAAPAPSPAAPKQAKWVIGFSNATFEDPWRQVMNEGMKREAAKHPEIELKLLDGQNSNDKQIETVKSFLQQGVDLLIISPREADALTGIVKEAHQKIPVIVVDRNIKEPAYTCFIGGNNLKIGESAANLVVKHFGTKPAVAVEIEGIQDATATLDRKKGFESVLARHPSLKIVYDQPADYKRAPAVDVMSAALQKFKRIDCVYAHNDEMALGAAQAAEAAGRGKEMIIIGIDAVQSEAIKAVIDGRMFATYFYPTCGPEAIQTALKILNGEKVPQTLELPTTEITQANAAKYYDPSSTLVIPG